MKVTAAN